MALPSPQLHETLMDVLGKYMSPILARSVLKRALERAGVTERMLSSENLSRVLQHLESGSRLFVEQNRSAALAQDLQRLTGPEDTPGDAHIPIKSERDISDARIRAWKMAERLGARRYTLQRVSTIVSELARNIASYTSGGTIDIVVKQDRDKKLKITARDSGPGIRNLDEIMSGRYRSRTGLGVGIVATQRLSDRFDITTGPHGTTVEAEVNL